MAWLTAVWIAFAWSIARAPAGPADGELWFRQPAAKWTDALPVGNGRLGAMVFGGVPEERIQFNEDTLWKGEPHDYDRTGAKNHLAEIRRLLFAGETKAADEVARKYFLSDPVRQKAYQPFGDLHFYFTGQTNVTDYRRDLDLTTATVEAGYRAGGVAYHEEVFASAPDQVMVVRLTADRPGRIGFTLGLDSPQPGSETRAMGPDTLCLSGQVEAGGLRFEARVRVIAQGGQLTASAGRIIVQRADEVMVLLDAATSFKTFEDISGDPDARCAAVMAAAARRPEAALRAAQLADYQGLYDRVRLNLGRSPAAELPTDERLQALKQSGLTNDPALAALEFNYGRYLLISSSRPGGQPANLQGLWNEDLNPPWESKWTLNINCEMNYWPAEVCGLGECTAPLFAMIDDLTVSGGRTARAQYGCRGWVVHHNTDLWRGTAPINNIDGVWPTGGAWLCQHLWEHYLFTGDRMFLAHALPDMEGAALFFVDDLVTDPRTGWRVTSPSFSPEQGNLCYGPTMDNQLIRALLEHTMRAEAILGCHAGLAKEFARTAARLPPNQVGRYGQLQEWLADVDVPDNNHRHMSPLWALYPGADLTPADPRLWSAAKLLLKWRGAGSTGWSYAWRMPLWARVGDGDYAWTQLEGLLSHRTLPDLLDLCGPFQIDGNFGATAGVAEMLLQSQWTTVHQAAATRLIQLLPALPKAWPDGSVAGLRARDGFVVDLTWRRGALTGVTLHSLLGNPCCLRWGAHEVFCSARAGATLAFDGTLRALP